jgi:hypothetical protein
MDLLEMNTSGIPVIKLTAQNLKRFYNWEFLKLSPIV